MKIKYILFLFICATALSGCIDKLDIEKHGNVGSQDDFYETDEEVLQASAALYDQWYAGYYDWYFLKNLLADDVWCGGGGRGDNAFYEQLNEYSFGTENSTVESVYSNMYSIIYCANLIIEKVVPDTDVKKRVIAEAKFFRAYAHFELVTLWGNAPVIDHLLEMDEYHQPNGIPAEAWALIEQDLKEAIDSDALPSKSDPYDQETGIRITKETAQSYLGKAYVFQEKWPDAATMLDNVINSGKYELYTGSYDNLLHAVADNCSESILEGQIRNDPTNAWARYHMQHIMVAWRFEFMDASNIHSGYDDLVTSTGYGFFNPRKELYDAFTEREGADGYRLTQTMLTYEQVKNNVGMTIVDGKALYGHQGYFMWKNRSLYSDLIYYNAFNVLQHINNRVMRYAEVLLLAAEAHLRNGNTGKATEYVNQIRSRAQLTPLGSVSMDDIKVEKRLELCAESVRFQDLVRWGDAPAALATQGKEVYEFNGTGATVRYTNSNFGFQSGKHELLPIPSTEINVNPNIEQNPGW
ncbi:MAG: RagB/SusD family nutrient uptake outer membrane protein [Tannerellaceae bacterium]|nr:RagB/SusD family nutrient uptake outer membrane protein [Tannerellaceae bacterium]